MIRNTIIILGLNLLIGCSNNVPDFERTNIEINGQKFEILSTYAIFENYLNENNRYKDCNLASKRLIFKSFRKEILDNAEAAFMFNSIEIPYQTTDLLREQVKMLKSRESLEIIKHVLYQITKSLPGPNTKIIILPTNPNMQELLDKYKLPGYGMTIGSGKIIIAINPTSENWKEFLSYGIAHEYHHSTWISRNWVSSDFSLLDYLVFECRADAFAKSIFDSFDIPATKYLTSEQETYVWDLIKPELNEKGSERIIKVMYGTEKIPFGSGYAIGYGILKAFKENNPSYTDLRIIDLEPSKILELSRYKNKRTPNTQYSQ
jgi:uncharacterized protein YjaZ